MGRSGPAGSRSRQRSRKSNTSRSATWGADALTEIPQRPRHRSPETSQVNSEVARAYERLERDQFNCPQEAFDWAVRQALDGERGRSKDEYPDRDALGWYARGVVQDYIRAYPTRHTKRQ